MTTKLATPTIHSNGTSKESLIDAWVSAYDKIGKARVSLKSCAPNGRDYYPQGDGALEEATRQHLARLAALDGVMDELEALINVWD